MIARIRAAAAKDDGAASIQTAILYPLVLVLILSIIQGVAYFHAENVARHAADGAVRIARAETGTIEAGRAEAERRLRESGGGILRDSRVDLRRDGTSVTVTVSGHAPTLLPGLSLPVKQTAEGPVERMTEVGTP